MSQMLQEAGEEVGRCGTYQKILVFGSHALLQEEEIVRVQYRMLGTL
jgi:hypothetical protein